MNRLIQLTSATNKKHVLINVSSIDVIIPAPDEKEGCYIWMKGEYFHVIEEYEEIDGRLSNFWLEDH